MKWWIKKYLLEWGYFFYLCALCLLLSFVAYSYKSERDALREEVAECELTIANYDTCLVMCHEQLMLTTDYWNKCRGDSIKIETLPMQTWEPVECDTTKGADD